MQSGVSFSRVSEGAVWRVADDRQGSVGCVTSVVVANRSRAVCTI